MEVRNSNFAAFIDVFTSNTYVMVIMSDPSIREWQIRPFSAVTVQRESKRSFLNRLFSVLLSICSHSHQHQEC